MVGQLERYNPAMVALRPYVTKPLYFEIHRVSPFPNRSLDVDVVLDVMIHDLDAVQWLRELFGFASRHDAALMRALRPALIEFTRRLDPSPQNPGSPAAERFRSITDMPDGRLPHLFAESLARSFNAEIGNGPKED